MKKSTIKKRFQRLDEVSLPAKDAILPPEALTESDAAAHKGKTRLLPRLAIAAVSAVALIVVAALVIDSITATAPKNAAPHTSAPLDPVLDNESVTDETSLDSTDSIESEDPKASMPIVSCGKATALINSNEVPDIIPGDVAVQTMRNSRIPIEELQDGVLYAVWFFADYGESPQYKEGIKRLDDEERENKFIQADKVIAYLKENEKEKYDDCIEGYKHRLETYQYEGSLDDFRNFVLHYVSYSFPNGEWAPQWLASITSALRQNYEEYEKKREEFTRLTRYTAKAKIHEYLEGIGIEFYDKTVYLYMPKFDHDADEYNYDEKEILSSSVYRIAFLTKDEIADLKGHEDYGLAVVIAFDEMAKMDTEPVYLIPWIVNA